MLNGRVGGRSRVAALRCAAAKRVPCRAALVCVVPPVSTSATIAHPFNSLVPKHVINQNNGSHLGLHCVLPSRIYRQVCCGARGVSWAGSTVSGFLGPGGRKGAHRARCYGVRDPDAVWASGRAVDGRCRAARRSGRRFGTEASANPRCTGNGRVRTAPGARGSVSGGWTGCRRLTSGGPCRRRQCSSPAAEGSQRL